MADTAPSDPLLKAIAALLIDQRESRPSESGQRRTEELLDSVGLSAVEIAELTGKQASAIRMTLSRARRARSKPGQRDA
jgi:DNA-directed RNA polymerase specialized sigma24 family protein